jgi:hypothetical protein
MQPISKQRLGNTFPRIGPCYKCGDVINNRDGVFRGIRAECLEEKGVTEFFQGQLRGCSKLKD